MSAADHAATVEHLQSGVRSFLYGHAADPRYRVTLEKLENLTALAERATELEARRDAWVHEAVTNKDRARAAEARATELERALRFYADPQTWDADGRAWTSPHGVPGMEADEDRGAIARAALGEIVPLGEFHAEGLDERGIYSGRSFDSGETAP